MQTNGSKAEDGHMTRDDIIRMAKEVGIDAESDTLCRYEGWLDPLTQFANLAITFDRQYRQSKGV